MYRWTRLRGTSKRQSIINACLVLIRKEMKREYGNKCQICGRTQGNLGVFHILRRSAAPRLILHRENLLLSCWYPCHEAWHNARTDSPAGKRVQEAIIRLRGADYEKRIQALEAIQPRLTTVFLQTYLVALQKNRKDQTI